MYIHSAFFETSRVLYIQNASSQTSVERTSGDVTASVSLTAFIIIIIIIIIIIKQLVTRHMSVKNKLTNRSCGLATAVSDGKIC